MIFSFAKLDQDLTALRKRYGYHGAPADVDMSDGNLLSDQDAILYYANAAKNLVHAVNVEQRLFRTLEDDRFPFINDAQTCTEFIWILFAHKKWEDIKSCIEHYAEQGFRLPDHVADIYFLAVFRIYKKNVGINITSKEFLDALQTAHNFTVRHWENYTVREDFFNAILSHLSGDIQLARGIFSETPVNFKSLSFFDAVHSVIPRPVQSQDLHDVEFFPVNSEIVILVSVDKLYFEIFAYKFAKIVELKFPAASIHFHCVNFDPREVIEGWDISLGIGYTIDRPPELFVRGDASGTYYASARFLFAEQYLDHYNGIFVTDIDGKITNSPEKIFESGIGDDVLLAGNLIYSNEAITPLPWSGFSAGRCFFYDTAGARLFARELRNYLMDALYRGATSGRPTWYADQNALFYSWYDLRGRVKISRLRMSALSQQSDYRLFRGKSSKTAHLDEELQRLRSPAAM